jgi:hypothetical protein
MHFSLSYFNIAEECRASHDATTASLFILKEALTAQAEVEITLELVDADVWYIQQCNKF